MKNITSNDAILSIKKIEKLIQGCDFFGKCTAEEISGKLCGFLKESTRDLASNLNFNVKFSKLRSISSRFHTQLTLIRTDGNSITFELPLEWLLMNSRDDIRIFFKKIVPIIPLLSRLAPFRLLSFVFEIGDNGYLPSVSFCSKNSYSCLIYDYDFFASGGHQSYRHHCDTNSIAWEDKSNIVFWRGQTTGQRQSLPNNTIPTENFRWLQRLWLCDVASNSKHRGNCDIGITGFVQIPEEHYKSAIIQRGFLKEHVGKELFLKKRYIIDIDGNSNTWSALFTGLLSGASVMKVASQHSYRQWYYKKLIPFVNFIPIAHDFSDFDEALDWAFSEFLLTKEIAEGGNQLAKEITFESALIESTDNLNRWLNGNFSNSFN